MPIVGSGVMEFSFSLIFNGFFSFPKSFIHWQGIIHERGIFLLTLKAKQDIGGPKWKVEQN